MHCLITATSILEYITPLYILDNDIGDLIWMFYVLLLKLYKN